MGEKTTPAGSRKIIHMDLDAFFCAVEELNDPSLKNKPFAVGGSAGDRGVIASCSYAARRYGVHSAMPTAQALKLCPRLILISSRHGDYSRISKMVMSILEDVTPLMEQVSIDEAFIDVTDLPQSGIEIAMSLKQKIFEQTGLSASFGIAANKLMAKIANDYGKKQSKGDSYPGAIQNIRAGTEAEFLAPLPVHMLWGVGPKTADRLALAGIHKISDLVAVPESRLIELFGKNGLFLKRHAMGIDDSKVENYEEIKSISQEVTFSQDVSDQDTLIAELKDISEKIGYRLRKNKLTAQVVRVKIRYHDFKTFTRQKKLSNPFSQDRLIFEQAVQILLENWDHQTPIRLIGAGVSQLNSQEIQLSLWTTEDDKERKLLEVVDRLKDKYGKQVIRRASSIHKRNEEKNR